MTTLTDDEVDDKATALLHSAIDDAEIVKSMHQYRNAVGLLNTAIHHNNAGTLYCTNHEAHHSV